jgi:hypothetical protein
VQPCVELCRGRVFDQCNKTSHLHFCSTRLNIYSASMLSIARGGGWGFRRYYAGQKRVSRGAPSAGWHKLTGHAGVLDDAPCSVRPMEQFSFVYDVLLEAGELTGYQSRRCLLRPHLMEIQLPMTSSRMPGSCAESHQMPLHRQSQTLENCLHLHAGLSGAPTCSDACIWSASVQCQACDSRSGATFSSPQSRVPT